ncbi:hypothetical protein RRG08_054898 [Elysia crispata]|uniref:Uncharacterized protein n=1 Tax=Elysia crispata TaxID=231223 RepID=A0AAE1DSR4_9GAST|nr:hypothetical protein RRG08_054898 [Elysia crispata]
MSHPIYVIEKSRDRANITGFVSGDKRALCNSSTLLRTAKFCNVGLWTVVRYFLDLVVTIEVLTRHSSLNPVPCGVERGKYALMLQGKKIATHKTGVNTASTNQDNDMNKEIAYCLYLSSSIQLVSYQGEMPGLDSQIESRCGDRSQLHGFAPTLVTSACDMPYKLLAFYGPHVNLTGMSPAQEQKNTSVLRSSASAWPRHYQRHQQCHRPGCRTSPEGGLSSTTPYHRNLTKPHPPGLRM